MLRTTTKSSEVIAEIIAEIIAQNFGDDRAKIIHGVRNDLRDARRLRRLARGGQRDFSTVVSNQASNLYISGHLVVEDSSSITRDRCERICQQYGRRCSRQGRSSAHHKHVGSQLRDKNYTRYALRGRLRDAVY